MTTQNAEALDRATRLWDLRVLGLPWKDAARQVGVSNAQNAIRCVREAFGELPEPDKAEFRALVTERLDFWNREAMRTYASAATVRERTAAIRAGVAATTALARVTGVEADRPYSPAVAEIEAWVASALSGSGLPVEAPGVLGVVVGEGA